MAKDYTFKGLAHETQDYLSLSLDEIKLKITRGLSTALGRVLSYLLLFAILSLVLGLLSIALLQWLNGLIGTPWGTLIVMGVFLIVLLVLWFNRQILFKDLFVKLFIDVFYDTEDDE